MLKYEFGWKSGVQISKNGLKTLKISKIGWKLSKSEVLAEGSVLAARTESMRRNREQEEEPRVGLGCAGLLLGSSPRMRRFASRTEVEPPLTECEKGSRKSGAVWNDQETEINRALGPFRLRGCQLLRGFGSWEGFGSLRGVSVPKRSFGPLSLFFA